MEPLELQFAKTLLQLGYPWGSSASDLATKISWITEFEKPRVLVEWICLNLSGKNALSKDHLAAVLDMKVDLNGLQVEMGDLLLLEPQADEEEDLSEIEKEIAELKVQLAPLQERAGNLQTRRDKQLVVKKQLLQQEASLDASLKALENESREQDRHILVTSVKNDQSIKALQGAVMDLMGSLSAESVKGSAFLGTMTSELKRFEEENLKLEKLLESMLNTQTAAVTSNDAQTVDTKNAELKAVSHSTSVSERQAVEAQGLLEQAKGTLESIQKQISGFEGQLSLNFEALGSETLERRKQLEAVQQETEDATEQLRQVCDEVGATRSGPVLLRDFDLRIEATHTLLTRLDNVTELLIEKHNRDQVLAVGFLVELKDHLKVLHLLGKLLSHLELQVNEHQQRMKKFEQLDVKESATVVRSDDAYLSRIHRLLLPPDDGAEILPASSTFLLPLSSLFLDSKRLAELVQSSRQSSLGLEEQLKSTLKEMSNASALLEKSLFQGKGSSQPVLTPLALVEQQARLQERVDLMQPKLRQVLKDMETSEELQLRTQLLQWFCTDPSKLEEHVSSLKGKLKTK